MIRVIVSQYCLLERLDRSEGAAYIAADTTLDGNVTLRFLPEELSKERQAPDGLERKAQAVCPLYDPSICAIYDSIGKEGLYVQSKEFS